MCGLKCAETEILLHELKTQFMADKETLLPHLSAVAASSYEMTYTLVAHGAWVEQVCRKKWTAMHEAAKVGNVEILLLLLRNGGRVNHKDITGVTPLAVAAEQGHFHIIEILLNCGQSEDKPEFNHRFTDCGECVNVSDFRGDKGTMVHYNTLKLNYLLEICLCTKTFDSFQQYEGFNLYFQMCRGSVSSFLPSQGVE